MVGLDLTEQEFDVINARVTAACNADGLQCENFAVKNCATENGFWMQVTGFEKYFTAQELAQTIVYAPITEETIEI